MSFQGSVDAFRPGTAGESRFSPEIGFLVSHGVDVDVLLEAERLAVATGVTADVALLRTGKLDEVRFYAALAAELALPFVGDTLDVHPRSLFPQAVLAGIAPMRAQGDGLRRYAYAPRGPDIARLLASRDQLPPGLSLTTPVAIRDDVMQARAADIAEQAADGLARMAPHLSFRDGVTTTQLRTLCAGCVVVLLLVSWSPLEALGFGMAAGGIAFLALVGLRLGAMLEPSATTAPTASLQKTPDRHLPVYTVLIALHREARVLPKLIGAISKLDYPATKLDVKLVLEVDDLETRAALQDVRLPAFVEVIVAPAGEPRTKPRALNVALPLARGEFVTVYDAEDVPDPGQLRLAVSIFRRSEPDVACLQARLVIDNAADCLLTRFFAIEYATLFDVTNSAMARFDLPFPLGGTSNHFRADILKGLGGWDAWNVTEDADLGIRLAAAGYRVGDLPSATLEEAPRRLRPWIRQRTRWMKGFLQVTITYSRRPLHNLRQLGAARFCGAVALTAGTVASALGYPVFMAATVGSMIAGELFGPGSPAEILVAAIGLTLFWTGLTTLTALPALALIRRRWWSLLPLAPLMPFYYLLVSLAAWRGLLELLVAPARWNKTDHGLATTTRVGRP